MRIVFKCFISRQPFQVETFYDKYQKNHYPVEEEEKVKKEESRKREKIDEQGSERRMIKVEIGRLSSCHFLRFVTVNYQFYISFSPHCH